MQNMKWSVLQRWHPYTCWRCRGIISSMTIFIVVFPLVKKQVVPVNNLIINNKSFVGERDNNGLSLSGLFPTCWEEGYVILDIYHTSRHCGGTSDPVYTRLTLIQPQFDAPIAPTSPLNFLPLFQKGRAAVTHSCRNGSIVARQQCTGMSGHCLLPVPYLACPPPLPHHPMPHLCCSPPRSLISISPSLRAPESEGVAGRTLNSLQVSPGEC